MLVEIRKIDKEEVTVVTSLDVAETFGKRHDNVLKDIRELKCSEEFRLLNFGQSDYLNQQNHSTPMYFMTRDGFTLFVMRYTSEKAIRFKEGYIRQFNEMEKALIGKIKEAVRQELTKAIQQSNENERMHGHAYSAYTNCIYKTLSGKDAKGLREQLGVSRKDNVRNALTEEELRKVQSMENLVSGLVDFGWDYTRVKDFIGEVSARAYLLQQK